MRTVLLGRPEGKHARASIFLELTHTKKGFHKPVAAYNVSGAIPAGGLTGVGTSERRTRREANLLLVLCFDPSTARALIIRIERIPSDPLVHVKRAAHNAAASPPRSSAWQLRIYLGAGLLSAGSFYTLALQF